MKEGALPRRLTAEDVRKVRADLPGGDPDGGMTQQEFASFLQVANATVSRWENGHFQPSRLARSKIETALARQRVLTEASA